MNSYVADEVDITKIEEENVTFIYIDDPNGRKGKQKNEYSSSNTCYIRNY